MAKRERGKKRSSIEEKLRRFLELYVEGMPGLDVSGTTESSESSESSEGTETSENTENSESSEASEAGKEGGKESSEDSESSEASENSEVSESSETTENSETTEDKEIAIILRELAALDPSPEEWGPIVRIIEVILVAEAAQTLETAASLGKLAR
jgi:hypothetical protein